MRRAGVQIKILFYLLLGCFVVMGTVSGYVYRENKALQYQNRRLILVNDSVLSENLELKNSLLQKRSSAATSNVWEKFK